jgi:prephenate dehydratase
MPPLSLAYLGPVGTNSETAAINYLNWLKQNTGQLGEMAAYGSIAQALRAVATGERDLAIVPIENSIEGTVAVTLDSLWQWENLRIKQALVLPIVHALISRAKQLADIQVVYSHPQALGQCQGWLEQFLPQVQRIPTNSTAESLQYLEEDITKGAIASPRAAQLYDLPVLAERINDYADNFTRFWIVGLNAPTIGSHTSLAFSVPANVPGALMRPLQIFASRGINMSRIESRPTRRSFGDYLFFVDVEADLESEALKSALEELGGHTEMLKIFGSYNIMS